jgi:hypothetical protein
MTKQPALSLGILALAFAFAQPAYAQATRTWVSGVGDDVNPCSRTAPCKTFAGAISKTAAGGEINCLDPGGYGTLTITKSITIDCTGTLGSTLNSGGINGFVINDSLSAAPATADVILRGITIDGAGSTRGLNGVRFISGRSLLLENVFIQNQSSRGVSIQPTTAVRVVINNTVMVNTGGGVLVQPTGTGTARVTVNGSVMTGGSSEGLRVDSSTTTGAALRVSVSDSTIDENPGSGIIVNAPGASPQSLLTLTSSTVMNNGLNGVTASGSSNAFIAIGGTTIQGNASGIISSGGGQLRSYGDNMINVNVITDGTFTGTLPKI